MVAGVCEVISTLMAQLLWMEGVNIIFKCVERLLRQGVETCIGKTTQSFASCVSSLFLILLIQSTLFPVTASDREVFPVWVFFPTPNNAVTPAGCPTI